MPVYRWLKLKPPRIVILALFVALAAQAEAAQAEKDAERDAAEGVGDARNEDPAPMDTKPIEEASSPLADGGRGKRRRGAVDYKALEAQLRKEEAQKKS